MGVGDDATRLSTVMANYQLMKKKLLFYSYEGILLKLVLCDPTIYQPEEIGRVNSRFTPSPTGYAASYCITS